MTNQNNSNRKWKIGIILLWLWILTIATIWYWYYNNWSKWSYSWSKASYSNTTQWWGCSMMWNRTIAQSKPTQTTTIDSQAQQIQMTYDESWLQPSIINTEVGKSYTISIKLNKDIYGCMSTITLPWLDENIQNIVKWNTITFNIEPTSAWEYEFLCAMWLSHGAKVVVK